MQPGCSAFKRCDNRPPLLAGLLSPKKEIKTRKPKTRKTKASAAGTSGTCYRPLVCHPERSECCAKRSTHAVEGSLSALDFRRCLKESLQWLVDIMRTLSFGKLRRAENKNVIPNRAGTPGESLP